MDFEFEYNDFGNEDEIEDYDYGFDDNTSDDKSKEVCTDLLRALNLGFID